MFIIGVHCEYCETDNELPLATCFTLVSCMSYSSTVKVEATCSFETSVDFQWTARYYILENITYISIQRWMVG
jgi:hypothetical protein